MYVLNYQDFIYKNTLSIELRYAGIQAIWLVKNGHKTWNIQKECYNSSIA